MDRAKFWLTPKNQVNDVTGSSLLNNQLVFDLFWCKTPSRPRSKFLTRPRSIPPSPPRSKPPSHPQSRPRSAARVFAAEDFFTFKCDSCFKWRLIPSKDKYEEILEYMGQHLFVCEKACEWRPNISCDDIEDISLDEDDSWIWAFDKLGTPKTPDGWQRLVKIRGERRSHFADVYYRAPSGQEFRSKPEVEKFLADHPEYITDGVDLSRFSFTRPKSLQEYNMKKRSRAKSVEPKQDSPVSSPAKKQATTSFIHEDEESPAPYDLWQWI